MKTSVHEILRELNENNSSNYKLDVLKKYKDNELFKRVLSLANDKVRYNFGITMKNISYSESDSGEKLNLSEALDILESKFCTREFTGNKAIEQLQALLSNCSKEDAEIIEKIISRDLKINCGRTQINKVHKDLIVKPIYMRCDIYNAKTAKNINFPAFVQLKADGLACFTRIENGGVTCYTRSGEEFILESLQYLKNNSALDSVTLQGELLIDGISNRSESNGLVNSLIKYKQGTNKSLSKEEADEIESKLIYQIWDFVSIEDMKKASDKDESGTPYIERFGKLNLVVNYQLG